MLHPRFPLGCDTRWFTPGDVALSADEKLWLLDPGSLTTKLQQRCTHLTIKLIGQQWLIPAASESPLLNTSQPVLVREVLLVGDNTPWIFARSLLTRELTEQLGEPGLTPLGEQLFGNPDLNRSPFELTRISASHPLCLQLSLDLPPEFRLWGRRSTLSLNDATLLVQEIFLPSSPLYREQS